MTPLGGCAHPRALEDPVVRAARRSLGAGSSGDGPFLDGVLRAARRPPLPSTDTLDAPWLHALARLDGRLLPAPRAGAIVFFGQTVRAFHAGVVERVEGPRLTFLHADRDKVRRGHCDLSQPHQRRDGRGRIVNSYLLPRRRDDLPGTRYLCGELVLGYAAF